MFHVKHLENIYYYKTLYKLALKSYKNNDIPVGAIVIYNNKIIGKGYNNRQKKNSVIGHAEINAIINAEKYINDWRLNDCILLTTLKPCEMCAEVINKSRISNVYYILDQKNIDYPYNFSKLDFNNEYIDKYNLIFLDFFKNLR